MIHKGTKSIRKRQADIKPKVTRKISKNKTVESSKISKNKTIEQSKISENKKVKPSDDLKYQSEYSYNCHGKI